MDELGFMCLIALEDCAEVLERPLRHSFEVISPRSSLEIEARPEDESEQAALISVDGHAFACAVFEGTMPEPEYSLALRRSVFWPDAGREMSGHGAFLVLAAAERLTSHGLARAQSVALTRLAAAIVEAMPALGVYWRGAEHSTSPERISRAPSEIAAGQWPVDIWIGYEFFGLDDQRQPIIGLQTQGAAPYLGFELEVPPFQVTEKTEPMRILFNAVAYLMNFGDVIQDGQLVEVRGERRTQYQLIMGARGEPGLARLSVLGTDHRKMN